VSITALAGWRQALLVSSFMACVILLLLFWRRHVLMGSNEQRYEEATARSNASVFSFDFLKLPVVWMCWGFFFLSALALSGIQSFATTAMQVLYDLPLTLTSTAITTYMLGSAGGMLLGGFVARRVRFPERVIAVSLMLGSSISLLIAMTLVSGSAMMTLFTIMGFCVGISQPSRDLMIRSATPKEASGRVFGIVYSGLDSGLAIGPLMFGLLMDWKMEQGVFICIAIFLLLSLLTAYRFSGSTRAHHQIKSG